ncbi:MAG: hypothetical protein AB7S71_07365 [Dongiaceae bacterium]
MTDDRAKKDTSAGEMSGPAFLPLRQRPAATKDRTSATDNTAGDKAADRRQRPTDRLRFAPDQG